MKVLLTGASGGLGSDILPLLKVKNYDVDYPTRSMMDLSDENSIINYLKDKKYDIIIHSGAYTNVDKAETESSLCYKVNVISTKLLLENAKLNNSKFLFVSTDYVFDGESNKPYTTFSDRNPINVYGKSKTDAEDIIIKENYKKCFIVRTSLVFGCNGNNFFKRMIELSSTNQTLKVVDDIICSITFTRHLATFILNLIETEKYDIYHAVNEGWTSRYEYVKELFKILNIDTKVEPVSSNYFPVKAKRPLYSVLNTQKTIDNSLSLLPVYQQALKEYTFSYKNILKTF